MAVVTKTCLAGESFARNGPVFKIALSLPRHADLRICVLPQNSMTGGAFCETAVFRGGRSMFLEQGL